MLGHSFADRSENLIKHTKEAHNFNVHGRIKWERSLLNEWTCQYFCVHVQVGELTGGRQREKRLQLD